MRCEPSLAARRDPSSARCASCRRAQDEKSAGAGIVAPQDETKATARVDDGDDRRRRRHSGYGPAYLGQWPVSSEHGSAVLPLRFNTAVQHFGGLSWGLREPHALWRAYVRSRTVRVNISLLPATRAP